jgi:hypothetical protein
MPALGVDFERTLHAQPSDVRRAIVDALRQTGFDVTADQLTRVEAKRGSRLLGGVLTPARMLPVIAWFDLASGPNGSTVSGHLVDQGFAVGGQSLGSVKAYRRLFDEELAALDRGLGRLDATAAPGFQPGRFWSQAGEIAALEQFQARGSQAGAAVIGKVMEVLEGGSRDRGPVAWKGVDSVTFSGPKGLAVLALEQTQAHLGVAAMIVGEEGSLPPRLRAEVEAFAARAEATLTNAPDRAVTVPIPATEQPVFEFLHQQVRIRDGLPVRTLNTCRTCHYQRITNEDLGRIQVRNMRLRGLVGGVGATLSGGTVQPFVILGQLFRLKRLDPDYVCPRCQGMDADERIVTFCPSCGELRPEPVLRLCRKCGYDFRGALQPEVLWLSPQAAAARVAALASGPADTQAAQAVSGAGMAAGPAATGAPAEPLAAGVPTGPAAAAAAASLFCPFCGAGLGPGYAFCPGCGARIDLAAWSAGGPSR